MKFPSLRYLLMAVAIVLVGCNKTPEASKGSSTDAVLAVIRAQTDALNREDAVAYMATIDPTSPAFEQTKETMAKLFQAYDLRYTVKEMTPESVTDNEAKVRFTQLTEKVAGPEFRNNRIEGRHTLKKLDGSWRVSATEIIKLEYLDK